MVSNILKKFMGIFFVVVIFSIVSVLVSSPRAKAANFSCSKSDAAYAVSINIDPSAPAWIRGCFQRITVNEGWTGTVSFMYLSPESNDLTSGNKTATLKVLYYYRGVSGIGYAGMCSKVNSTSNSSGQTNIMDLGPDAGFGFTFPCSGWLGHNSYSTFSKTVTLYASKFSAGSGTATFNYRVAADFSKNSDGTDKSGLYCYDFANVVPAPTVGPPNPPWKTPPCVADGSNYTFINIIKTPPVYDGTIKITKNPSSDGNVNGANVWVGHNNGWEAGKLGNNPASFIVWVNSQNHNLNSSNSQYPYFAAITVPGGWRVKNATRAGSNVTPSCAGANNTGTCKVTNVTVANGGTTNVVFTLEKVHDSNLDTASCPRVANGFKSPGVVAGWVQRYDTAGADVHIYYDNPAGTPGKQPDAIILKKDLVKSDPNVEQANGQPIYRFSSQIPERLYDRRSHRVWVYSFDINGPFLVNGSPKSFECPGPQGAARCLTENGINYFQGWGMDPQRPGTTPSFKFYFDGSSTPEGVVGTELRPAEVAKLKADGYPGILDATKYGFKYQIPDKFHDGANHSLKIKLSTLTTPDHELSYVLPSGSQINFGPNIDCGGGTVDPWFWPWLQTQNGDVIASGKITGQLTDLPGSRPQSATDKEAEYLVVSALGGGGSFCSTYNYILTNTSATAGNCSNGNGYTVLKKYQLGDNANDSVYKSIEKTFIANGAGNASGGNNVKCSPYNTFTALPSGNIDTATSSVPANNCLNGTIFKLPPSSTFGGFNVIAGRLTIFIDGSIDITNNIKYTYVGYSNPKALPNLAIIVRGNVNIGPNVTQLDAAIYATGKVNTCLGYNPGDANSTVACNQRLTVNGMLVGKDGFSFGRSFYNQTSRNSAEFISLTGQTVAFPPPGLESGSFADFDNSVRIDSGEFQPRF